MWSKMTIREDIKLYKQIESYFNAKHAENAERKTIEISLRFSANFVISALNEKGF